MLDTWFRIWSHLRVQSFLTPNMGFLHLESGIICLSSPQILSHIVRLEENQCCADTRNERMGSFTAYRRVNWVPSQLPLNLSCFVWSLSWLDDSNLQSCFFRNRQNQKFVKLGKKKYKYDFMKPSSNWVD